MLSWILLHLGGRELISAQLRVSRCWLCKSKYVLWEKGWLWWSRPWCLITTGSWHPPYSVSLPSGPACVFIWIRKSRTVSFDFSSLPYLRYNVSCSHQFRMQRKKMKEFQEANYARVRRRGPRRSSSEIARAKIQGKRHRVRIPFLLGWSVLGLLTFVSQPSFNPIGIILILSVGCPASRALDIFLWLRCKQKSWPFVVMGTKFPWLYG